jgi:hypothetical protein
LRYDFTQRRRERGSFLKKSSYSLYALPLRVMLSKNSMKFNLNAS